MAALKITVAKLENGNVGMKAQIGESLGRNYELTPELATQIANQLLEAAKQGE